MPWTLTYRAVIVWFCSCKSESVLHVVGKGNIAGGPFFTKNDAGRLLFPAVRGRSCVVLIGNSPRHEVAVYLGNSPPAVRLRCTQVTLAAVFDSMKHCNALRRSAVRHLAATHHRSSK